jgi:hypothetical protein
LFKQNKKVKNKSGQTGPNVLEIDDNINYYYRNVIITLCVIVLKLDNFIAHMSRLIIKLYDDFGACSSHN